MRSVDDDDVERGEWKNCDILQRSALKNVFDGRKEFLCKLSRHETICVFNTNKYLNINKDLRANEHNIHKPDILNYTHNVDYVKKKRKT